VLHLKELDGGKGRGALAHRTKTFLLAEWLTSEGKKKSAGDVYQEDEKGKELFTRKEGICPYSEPEEGSADQPGEAFFRVTGEKSPTSARILSHKGREGNRY